MYKSLRGLLNYPEADILKFDDSNVNVRINNSLESLKNLNPTHWERFRLYNFRSICCIESKPT